MSQTLILSDTLYGQLEAAARARGLSSVEELIRQWVDELYRRQETVRRIDLLREKLFAKYGEMSDSVELVRADRER